MTSLHRTIHGGLRHLGISEEADQRALYQRVTGQTRLSLMTFSQEEAVVAELRRLGFKPASKPSQGSRKKLSGPYASKLQALWIAGWNLGIVRDRDDSALIAFVKRQTGLDAVQFLHHADDARSAIEALKKWLAREGGVDWRIIPGTAPPSKMHRPPTYRIASAQWMKLYGNGQGFVPEILGLTGRQHHSELTSEDWIRVMNEFGRRIREKAAS